MINTVALLSSMVVLVVARPQQYQQPGGFNAPQPSGSNPNALARILTQAQEDPFDGNFNYAFSLDNGISQNAEGRLNNKGTEQEAQSIEGSYSFTSPEGQVITIQYIADEGGFRATGDAIPTPPPIPPAIARALDYIRSLPPDPSQKV